MALVEEDGSLRAPEYERPLRFTYDNRLDRGGGFRYVYEQGEIHCSRLGLYSGECRMAPGDLNAIARRDMKFVYLDAGRWGAHEYSFGLVSGRDCYLCEYVPGESFSDDAVPQCRNTSVNDLFTQLWALNCGVRVINYAQAPDVSPETENDRRVYLLLPDYHLPPISWFYPDLAGKLRASDVYNEPPEWFCNSGPYGRHRYYYQRLYGRRRVDERNGRELYHESDIFLPAGSHLVRFLGALARLSSGVKGRLHVINLGDMFELWLNREYQFVGGEEGGPVFRGGGADNAADWTAEVMLANMGVIETHRALETASLAEVSYLWGNHDAYLMHPDVTSQVGLPPRSASYTGLNGDLHIEHGHRFDSKNHDKIKSSDGPWFANLTYHHPRIRDWEKYGRSAVSLVTGSPEVRDSFLLGASLLYLHHKLRRHEKPFSVFCMGHTHSRFMRVYNITALYSLHGNLE
jgi:hypothetical protein